MIPMQTGGATAPTRYISAEEGQQLFGVSKATWYRLAAARDFPRRVRLGTARAVRWNLAKVLAWAEGREGRR